MAKEPQQTPHLVPLSLTNVRQVARVLNRSFGQDPGTVFRMHTRQAERLPLFN